MGAHRVPSPAKLMVSLISPEDRLLMMAIEDLKSIYGEIDFLSNLLPFGFTKYYDDEMGTPLFRRFIAFKRLVQREALADIKERTNRVELEYSHDGSRKVNIDPGVLSEGNLVLATTKGCAHRPYLRDGIYADLTLIFRNRTFRPLEWTYPDYGQGEIIKLMNGLRRSYLRQLKGGEA
jgi:hypothetical protein